MIKMLLWIINKIESSPATYARIDNIKFYSREFLEASDQQDKMWVFLKKMDTMDRCMKKDKVGLRVVQGFTSHDATEDEIKEVTNLHQ